jgi:hypothetical protein
VAFDVSVKNPYQVAFAPLHLNHQAAQHFNHRSATDKIFFSVSGVSLKGLTLDAATLAFDVGVKNPYPVALPLLDLNYKVRQQLMVFRSPLILCNFDFVCGHSRVFSNAACLC